MTSLSLLLSIAAAVALAGYLGFRFLRNWVSRPVLRIRLSPVETPHWRDRTKIADLARAFEQHGFAPAGHYACLEFPSLIISGFVHPAEQTTGVLYEHPARGVWVDLFVSYDDGGSLTVSSAPAGNELDRMPHQTKLFSAGASVGELFAKLRAERRKTGRRAIAKEEFAAHFEAQYRKEMAWRADRGGATYLEVRRVAEAMGGSTGREKLEKAGRRLRLSWETEKKRPPGAAADTCSSELPGEFQAPGEFRRRLEEKSGPPPRQGGPVLPVYLALVSAIVAWCYHGYRYNSTNFPVSLTEIAVFFAVLIVLLLVLLGFREFQRRARMYPVLGRAAGRRPGAFLFMDGPTPVLLYARERWIGKVEFDEGGESRDAFTALEARIKRPLGRLAIHRKSRLDKVLRGSKKQSVPLSEDEFGRHYAVSATPAECAEKLLGPVVSGAVLRLGKIGRPAVEIDRDAVRVRVGKDLTGPRNEAVLRQFLEEAETIVEQAAREQVGPSSPPA